MNRRTEPYSYLKDPNSHVAHDKEKNTEYTALKKSASRSKNNNTGFTQNNVYHSSLESRRASEGSVTKNEIESYFEPRVQQTSAAKCSIAQPHNRWESNNTQEKIAPQARGAMSFQVQQRRMQIQSSLPNAANRKDIQKVANAKPGRMLPGLFDDNSLGEVARGAPLSPRKIISDDIEKRPEIKSVHSDDENILEAICSGDYVARMEDETMVVINSWDGFEEKCKHVSHTSSRKDVQTQTLLSGGEISQMEKLLSQNVHGKKRTEKWQSHTATLYARRSLSDTSIRRTKRSERPSSSPSQFVVKSTKFCKRTTECCVRPSTHPAQFLAKTTEISNCHSLTEESTEVCKRTTECCVRPSTPPAQFLAETTEISNCHSLTTTSDYQPSESLAINQLSVPEAIKDILKPLECNNESLPRCTTIQGMALSLAASFLLFLGLVWTCISMSLVTHHIVTQYLYPPEPDANQISQFLGRLYRHVEVIAVWLWYQVLY